ncbi:MAG TPA: uracil-DNA glycosylase, partial [Candidatus Dormibacteraeota bacterium]|nr:uracil-DNA glycosylase [Candidatus Dormibacteraeota bacterium]
DRACGGARRPVTEPSDPGALVDLHAAISACTACRLHETRTQAVPGDGPVTARIVAVGEAPGESEDQTGRPFVGAAGRLLTKLLGGIGLDRHDIYICNVLKCRPPQNRDPLPDEVAACARFLDAQIALIRPDVILLLGRHATARLLPGQPPISRCHGERVVDGDRAYVPLYHPAAALYNASMLATLEADMQRVHGYLEDAAARRAAATTRPQPAPPPPAARPVAARDAEAHAADTDPRRQLSLF